jgi:hypothetical protein
MVIEYERLAVAILDRFQLEPWLAVKFAAKGNGILDRGELEKVVLAFTRAGEQQQDKPNRLHCVSPRQRRSPTNRRKR